MSEAPSELEAFVEGVATRPSLVVTADLTVTVRDHDLSVTSFTDLIRVDCPSLAAALALLRGARATRRVRAVVETLAAAGLTVVVAVRGRPVARAGADVSPGLLGSRLGLGPVRVSPRGLLLGALA